MMVWEATAPAGERFRNVLYACVKSKLQPEAVGRRRMFHSLSKVENHLLLIKNNW